MTKNAFSFRKSHAISVNLTIATTITGRICPQGFIEINEDPVNCTVCGNIKIEINCHQCRN